MSQPKRSEPEKSPAAVHFLLIFFLLTASCAHHNPRDPFSEFFQQKSLTVREYRIETRDDGYQITLTLEDPADPSRLVDGFMVLTDREQQRQLSRLREEERQQERIRLRQLRLMSPNLRMMLSGFALRGFPRASSSIIYAARPLDTERIRARFPDFNIYLVSGSDPSMHPYFTRQPLVIPLRHEEDSSSFLNVLLNAPTVAAFMNEHKQPVADLAEAGKVISLLAELQGWERVQEMPAFFTDLASERREEWVSRWTYREVEEEGSWFFAGVFLTDPRIEAYHYLQARVSPDGSLEVLYVEDL